MATPKTESNGRIVKQDGNGNGAMTQQKAPPSPLVVMMNDKKFLGEIARALPKHVTPDRMARIIMTALRTTPKLALCTQESFLGCVLQAAQLGLEVNTPMQHAWLIPRKNGKLSEKAGFDVYETTLLVGYQGQIELSMRSGKIAGISAQVVREGDFFEFEEGLTPKLVHRRSGDPDRENKLITHAYAVARIKDAEPAFEVLSAKQLEARANRSANPPGSRYPGPWDTDLDSMCRKTAVRALWKWIPKSSEMSRVEYFENEADRGASQLSAFDVTVHDSMSNLGVLPTDGALEADASNAQSAGTAKSQPSHGDPIPGKRFDKETGQYVDEMDAEPGSDG